MTNEQVFFALTGVVAALGGFMKYYLDAKIDPVAKQVDTLAKYMVDHESRISKLEERTK